MTGLPNIKPGDRLVLVEYHKDDRTVYVTRVGRTYIYVAATPDGGEMGTRFHRDSGVEDTQTGYRGVLLTPEQHDESSKRSGLLADLSSAGVEIRPKAQADMPTSTLTALLAVVRPTEER